MWTNRSAHALLAAFVIVLESSGVHASEPSRLGAPEATTVCPSRAAVGRELLPLLGGTSIPLESSTQIRIEDLGGSYRVGVGRSERLVSDPQRNCGERAKVSAVFIALNLPHRRSPESAAPALATTPPGDTTRRGDLEADATTWRLMLRALLGFEHAPEPGRWASGLTLGGGLRRGTLGATLSAGLQGPVAIAAVNDETTTYELWRMPASLSVSYGVDAGSLGAMLEGGLALDVLHFRGLSVPNPDAGVRLNGGLRVSLAVRLRASQRLAALLVPTFAYYPRTYLVRLEPTRLLGESPRMWWGIGIGLESSVLGG